MVRHDFFPVGAPEGMEIHEKDFWGISSPSGSPVHTLERSWQSLGKGIIMWRSTWAPRLNDIPIVRRYITDGYKATFLSK